MIRRLGAFVATATIGLGAASQTPRPPSATAAEGPRDAAALTALVKQYCVTCHNDRLRTGGVSLAAFDVAAAANDIVVSEKMIRKLGAGMMPPAGARRPDQAALDRLADELVARVDRAAALNPDPGFRPFQRLNRAEYARAVKDLLGIDVDINAFLPPDTISHGFDNVADAQTFSPTLMQGYLRAAGRIAALAVGDPEAEAGEVHYRVPKTASQLRRVEGAPFGTRGGISVVHVFPADGDYVFRADLHGNADGFLFGAPAGGEQLEVSVDGERRALIRVDERLAEVTTGLAIKTPPIHVTAGPHRVTAAFIERFEGPVLDLVAPIDHTLADTQIGVAHGITTLPHLKELSIVGPARVTGVSDTVSRRAIFTCRPTTAGEEGPCAARIVRRLANEAFRRPVGDVDFERLMRFFEQGRKERDFELGVASALEAILASPRFVFRLEAAARPDGAGRIRRVGEIELASRLSYFIWGAAPDADLLAVAASGRLGSPGVLEKQVRRLLADRRSESLATRFAGQWLRLHDVAGVLPDAIMYPYYDSTLGRAFVRETELFFDSLVREDRSILELLTADYTFANERVARHYGIPNVTGTDFRRVALPEDRRGILGHGSVLVLTSVADRTSPVMRGKWVLDVLLGSPPPPPPPNVPSLDDSARETAGGRFLTVRERMEEHRRNPACASCHRVIDPLGLALENFDNTGRWRIRDNGHPIDATGELYDGTTVTGPRGLREAILRHQGAFLSSFTESLLTYALGRRVAPADMPAVRTIIRDAGTQGLRTSSFVLGVVKSAPFQMTRPNDTESAPADRR
jgi:mono/diheme cytochrome c family protein